MKTPEYDYMYWESFVKVDSENDNRKLLGTVMIQNLKKSRVFRLPRELSELFLETDADFDFNYLPFDNIFIEQKFIINKEASIGGIIISKLDMAYNVDTKKWEKNNGIWCCASVILCGKRLTLIFDLDKKQNNAQLLTTGELLPNEPFNKHIRLLVSNFLFFVNSPDIEYITVTDSKRDTEIRRRKGRPQRPPIANIILTNPLKRYIYKQKHNETMVYSHRFWVRGHWRTLRNKKYGDNVGKKLWIKPYIKGDGLLINKTYSLRPGVWGVV